VRTIKRRVIQIAESTQLISLPRKWAQKYNIKKGDELDIDEQGSKIVISTDKPKEVGYKEVNITDLDRDSLMYLIRFLYIKGYEEVKLIFDKVVVEHYRTGTKVKINDAISYEVNRLSGFEIIQQKDNYYIIKSIGESSIKDFDVVLRRIFLLLLDAFNDIMNNSNNEIMHITDILQEKHNIITKFICANLRLLNRVGYNEKNNLILYHILYGIDNLIDILKEISKDLSDAGLTLSKVGNEILQLVNSMLKDFQRMYFSFDQHLVAEISMKRYTIINTLKKHSKKIEPLELMVLCKMESIAFKIMDLSVNRIMMEY